MRPSYAIVAVLGIAAVSTAASYLRGSPGKAPAARAAAAPAARPGVSSADAKLDAAIECINYVSSSMRRSADNYARDVDPATGPSTAIKGNVYIGRIELSTRLSELEAAIAAPPAVPELDAVAKTYVEVVKALTPLVNDASDYYDQKRHLDDAYARGKELHPRLVDGFAGFTAADRALRAVVDARGRARAEAKLDELKADPAQRGEYVLARFLLVAEDVVRATDVGAGQDLDAAAFGARTAELDKAATELMSVAENPATPIRNFDGIEKSQTRSFVTAALALARRLRDKTPYSDSELDSLGRGQGQHIDGSVPQLISAYNDLINTTNRR